VRSVFFMFGSLLKRHVKFLRLVALCVLMEQLSGTAAAAALGRILSLAPESMRFFALIYSWKEDECAHALPPQPE